jgi:hypothetical protein
MHIMHIKTIKTVTEFKEAVAEVLGHKYPIQYSWVTGGYAGGSCWDTGPSQNYPREVEQEPEDESLTKLLKLLRLKLRFFNIKIDTEGLWHIKDECTNEYYGNSRESTTKTLRLDVLFERLKEQSSQSN